MLYSKKLSWWPVFVLSGVAWTTWTFFALKASYPWIPKTWIKTQLIPPFHSMWNEWTELFFPPSFTRGNTDLWTQKQKKLKRPVFVFCINVCFWNDCNTISYLKFTYVSLSVVFIHTGLPTKPSFCAFLVYKPNCNLANPTCYTLATLFMKLSCQ